MSGFREGGEGKGEGRKGVEKVLGRIDFEEWAKRRWGADGGGVGRPGMNRRENAECGGSECSRQPADGSAGSNISRGAQGGIK